jgi:hypothetical protein
MKKTIFAVISLLASSVVFAEESMITPADLSDEAMATTNNHIMGYNRCMMNARLSSSNTGQQVQQAADDILANCETHLDQLKAHLLAHNVNEGLAMGMGKTLRSRAARQLMTRGMNQMAAQAAAVVAAEEMKAEQSASPAK